MAKKVLIVGAGISGIACANNLKNNHEIWLLEKNDAIGGLSKKISCKATDACNYCGWCLVNENLKEFEKNRSKIKILLRSNIINAVKKASGGFEVEIQEQGKPISLTFDNIIFTHGAKPFDARKKPGFGYGKFKNVITGYDLEKNLRTQDLSKVKEIAFVQCVGSRDESINALYCSKICCRYAVRMINYLVYKYPEIKPTIFYMDLQVQGADIAKVYEKIKEKITFVKGIPSFFEEHNGKISMRFEDQYKEAQEKKEYGLVVLSVGLTPHEDNEVFSKQLGINLDENGFISVSNGFKTNIEGIFALGPSASPDSIKNSIIYAKSITELIK